MPIATRSPKSGTFLQHALSLHGIDVSLEQAADVADLLLNLVERGVLVSPKDPIVHNMGSSVHRTVGDAA